MPAAEEKLADDAENLCAIGNEATILWEVEGRGSISDETKNF